MMTTNPTIKLKFSEVYHIIDLFYRERNNMKVKLYIEGSPGIGKSSAVYKYAKDNDLDLIVVNINNYEPTEVKGLPEIVVDTIDSEEGKIDKITVWSKPFFIRRKGKGIIFLDEFTQGSQYIQTVFMRFLLENRIGDYTIGKDWCIIAAGNKSTDLAGTFKKISTVVNRITIVNMEADLDEWLEWGKIYNKDKNRENIHPLVRLFVSFRKELFSSNEAKLEPFESPRSWEAVSDIIYGIEHSYGFDVPRYLLASTITGTVGLGAGNEFVGFFENYKVCYYKLNQYLQNPEELQNAPLSNLYAIVSAILYESKKADINKLKAMVKCLTYIDTLSSGKELSMFGMKYMLEKYKDKVVKFSETLAWLTKYGTDLSKLKNSINI